MSTPEPSPYDLSRPHAAQRERHSKALAEQQIEADDIRRLMSSKWGRRFMCRLLDTAGVFKLSFHSNAMTMAFNEGNRNFGNRLLADITKYCPDRYMEMLKEQKQDEHRNASDNRPNPN